MPDMTPRTLAVPAVAALALSWTVGFAGAASAHVTVNPPTAAGGSYATLTFRVPTESDTASTTKVALYLPTHPVLASVSVKPHPGWRYALWRKGDAVRRIVWRPLTAQDRLRPGQFEEFEISAGPLPASGTVVFNALQTYSDGSVVRWIQPRVAGEPEPEHPAPVLTIAAASSGNTTAATPEQPVVERQDSSRTPLVLSGLAVAFAASSLLLSVLGRRRS